MDTKGCVQMTQNYTYFADIWLSSVKAAEEAMDAGVDYCGPAKTSHKSFYLATLETLMKDCTVGSYIVMKITPIVYGGRPIITNGYKYNSRKVLGFIATKGDGSTEPGDPYLSCFPDIYSNVSVSPLFVLKC